MNTQLMHPDDHADMCGDGYHNEHQRQHAVSRLEHSARQSGSEVHDQIARLLASGRHVAVAFQPVYCRSTDAYIGESKSVMMHAPSREALDAALLARFETDDNFLDDGRIEILPALPAPAPAPYGEPGGIDGGVPF
jgi:ferritin-like metal-binding protein YciE